MLSQNVALKPTQGKPFLGLAVLCREPKKKAHVFLSFVSPKKEVLQESEKKDRGGTLQKITTKDTSLFYKLICNSICQEAIRTLPAS